MHIFAAPAVAITKLPKNSKITMGSSGWYDSTLNIASIQLPYNSPVCYDSESSRIGKYVPCSEGMLSKSSFANTGRNHRAFCLPNTYRIMRIYNF